MPYLTKKTNLFFYLSSPLVSQRNNHTGPSSSLHFLVSPSQASLSTTKEKVEGAQVGKKGFRQVTGAEGAGRDGENRASPQNLPFHQQPQHLQPQRANPTLLHIIDSESILKEVKCIVFH